MTTDVQTGTAYQALTEDWQTTQQIAEKIGLTWRPGRSGDLAPLRMALFALHIYRKDVEHDPKHNGYRWRLSSPQEPNR